MARVRTCRQAGAALGFLGLLLIAACAQPAPTKSAPAPVAAKKGEPAPATKKTEAPPPPGPTKRTDSAPPPGPMKRTDPAPVREAPQRPPDWKATKLYGVDYVSLEEVAKKFGFTTSWVRARDELRLKSQWTELIFELDKREVRWNGHRVFLGEPIVTNRRMLWVAEIDIRTTLVPLLQPAAVAPASGLRLIVLDPGHGGTDPGTQNEKMKLNEKTFTLDVAQRLKPLLEARGYKVLLTRDKDTRFHNSPAIDLPMRADFANKAMADLFLSIHFNALGNAEVHGIETYAYTPANQRSSGEDNRSPVDEKAQPVNRHDHWSVVAAANIHETLRAQVEGFDRGLKRARWRVLSQLACPGVLIECGFLTNEAEARKINTPAHRQKIAEGIAAGVDGYAARLKEAMPAPTKP